MQVNRAAKPHALSVTVTQFDPFSHHTPHLPFLTLISPFITLFFFLMIISFGPRGFEWLCSRAVSTLRCIRLTVCKQSPATCACERLGGASLYIVPNLTSGLHSATFSRRVSRPTSIAFFQIYIIHRDVSTGCFHIS